MTPGWGCKERILLDYELLFVKEGSLHLMLNGETLHIEPGNAIFLRPGQPHALQVPDDTLLIQPHIHFDPIYDAYSRRRYISFKDQEDMTPDDLELLSKDIFADIPIPTVLSFEDPSIFSCLLYEIIDAWNEQTPYRALFVKQKMIELLLILFNRYDNRASNHTGKTQRHQLMHYIRSYITENYNKNISLDSIAQQFAVSKFTFTRQFKELFGESVIEYRNTIRLKHAKQMLAHTDQSVSEISSQLGFLNVYDFSRFFKNRTGQSPLKYRSGKKQQ